ncbi:MAG: hypothetical protein FWD26_07615 [Treponema sp.]|nr:hypothetical protein [Treponema sp.]
MLNFVARVFRGWMNVLLWLVLIGCAIGGIIVSRIVWGYSVEYIFLGLILGGFIGLIIVILTGGLISNFLNMVDNVEKQYKLLKHIYKNDIPNENDSEKLLPEQINESKSINGIENSKTIEDTIFIDESINMGEYKSKLKFYVRESPSLSSKELFAVEKDEILIVIACGNKVPDSSLSFVKNKNGMKGWCYFNNLKKI